MSNPRRRSLRSLPNPEAANSEQSGAQILAPTSSRGRPSRVTPRNSDAEGVIQNAVKETPYASLRQLAGMMNKPSTPQQRPSSVGPSSVRKSARRTPGTQRRTPAGASRVAQGRVAAPSTPHGIRAMQQRRNLGLTPGRDRRRSAKGQRDTPRDLLRGLSRILAPGTRAADPSPQTAQLHANRTGISFADDDLEKDPDLPRPRLSMPLDDEDDDSFHLPPPKISASLEDDNYTTLSVERPRRATNEKLSERLSRGSIGSLRTSDRFLDMTGLGSDAVPEEGDEGSFARPQFEDYNDDDILEPSVPDQSITFDIANALQEGIAGRQSDVGSEITLPVDGEESFAFTVPQRQLKSPLQLEVESRTDDESADESEPFIADVMNSDEELDNDKDMLDVLPIRTMRKITEKPLRKNISRHGIEYPSLPVSVVRKMAASITRSSGNRKSKINKEMLDAIMQASDWFFEQASDDLGAYAKHAGRKTIDESDIITLMKRQRQINNTTTPFSLAQRYLPRELLQDIRMDQPIKLKRARSRLLATVQEDDEEE